MTFKFTLSDLIHLPATTSANAFNYNSTIPNSISPVNKKCLSPFNYQMERYIRRSAKQNLLFVGLIPI